MGGYVGPNNSNNFVFHRLEAHRLSDGRLGHWSPNTDGGSPGTSTTVGPQVMATDGTQLFVGGDQSQLNGQRQQGLARFSLNGGNSAPEVPTTPRVTPTAAGTLSISVEAVSDDNDGTLTYRLYRDGGASADRDPDGRVVALVQAGAALHRLRPHRRHESHLPAHGQRRDGDDHPWPGQRSGHRRLAEPARLPGCGHCGR